MSKFVSIFTLIIFSFYCLSFEQERKEKHEVCAVKKEQISDCCHKSNDQNQEENPCKKDCSDQSCDCSIVKTVKTIYQTSESITFLPFKEQKTYMNYTVFSPQDFHKNILKPPQRSI